MPRIYYLFCVLFLSGLSSVKADAPVYVVKKTSQAINADGNLDEPLWASLDSISLLECTVGDQPLTYWTRAKAAWDSHNLYLSIITQDRDVWATISAHDGALFTEEMLEFFIDPDCDGKNYFEYEFNCKNTFMDMFMKAPYGTDGGGGNISWSSSNISFKVVVNGTVNNKDDIDSGMVLEAKIPWADLKSGSTAPPKPSHGTRMWVNIYRGDGRTTKTYSCWSPVGGKLPGSFHSPQLFGTFQFSDSLVMPVTQTFPQKPMSAAENRFMIDTKFAGNHLFINYKIPAYMDARISLSDLSGKILFRELVVGGNGEQTLLYKRSQECVNGIYLLYIKCRAGTVSKKVLW